MRMVMDERSDRQTDKHRHTGKQTDKQIDRQIDRQDLIKRFFPDLIYNGLIFVDIRSNIDLSGTGCIKNYVIQFLLIEIVPI